MNAARIITATERLYTLAKRAEVSDDRDTRRGQIIVAFQAMCTDLGKIAMRFKPTDWICSSAAFDDLHSAAVAADETRVGAFVRLGGETALLTNLHACAAVLGFILPDAATAAEDDPHPIDEAAMEAVEGRSAAE